MNPIQRDLDAIELVLADVEDEHLFGREARDAFDRIAGIALAATALPGDGEQQEGGGDGSD